MLNIEDNYACIRKMQVGSDYYNRWQTIKNVYSPKLDVDLFVADAQYTPHDYERHCKNIYNILSQIIPENAYEATLNPELLFLLNVSVILHDVAMVLYLDKEEMRDNHSDMAKEYVKNEVISRNNNLLSEVLNRGEAEFISEIVFGHSDVKENGITKIKTIESLTKSPKTGELGDRVDVRLLSALLRFADELDINSYRIKFKHHLDSRIGENSKTHWRKCEIFALPNLDDLNKTQVDLRLHEGLIRDEGNFENDIKLANEVLRKIKSELKYLNETVFYPSNITWWHIESVIIFTEEDTIKNALEKNLSKQGSVEVAELSKGDMEEKKSNKEDKESGESEVKQNETGESQPVIHVIDERFSQRIDNWVKTEDLFKEGHYKLNEKFRARDWIDTTTLLSTNKFSNQITDKLQEYIESFGFAMDELYVLGEGFPGVVLSSSLGYKMQVPFSYVIPEKDFEYHTKEEKNISIPSGAKIILVTDSIIFSDTVDSIVKWLVKEHNIDEKDIIKILSVFYRKPITVHECKNKVKVPDNIVHKISCLNNTFPAEICSKETCIFNECEAFIVKSDNQ